MTGAVRLALLVPQWATAGFVAVENITLYWLTGTGASAARLYWEDGQALAQAHAAGQAPPEVSLPVGFTTFPGEIWRTLRSWVENSYPNVTYFNEVDRGGHFAAWEEPELFSGEVRAAFRALRDVRVRACAHTLARWDYRVAQFRATRPRRSGERGGMCVS